MSPYAAPHWMLWDDQQHLATHPTRLACVIEAIERGLAIRDGGASYLREGVEIVRIGSAGAKAGMVPP